MDTTLATATTADPAGLALATTTAYNDQYFRRTARTLPKGGTTYASAVSSDHPTGWWRLGEAPGATAAADSSGNGINGSYTGGVTLGQPGAISGDPDTAATFDGSTGYVWLGLNSSLQPNSLSLEAWFKTSTSAGMTILRSRWYGYNLGLNGSGQLTANVCGTPSYNCYFVTGSASVADGKWHHAVVTKDGSTVTLYLDGASVGSTPMTEATYYTNYGGIAIGRDGDYSGSYFNGSLDEVAVYPAALSAARVSTHYQLGVSGGTGATTAYTYYGGTETRTNPCPAGGSANQAGLLKLSTGPGPNAIVHEQIYDSRGRVVASRMVGDATWRCITYDGRDRIQTSTDSAGKQTSFTYSGLTTSSSYTDSGGTARTTTTQLDLVGRVVSYTDEQGTVFVHSYDQPGRETNVTRQFSGQSATQLSAASYDAAGRVIGLTDYSSGTARTLGFTYDAAGALATTTRPNGVTTTTAYDANTGRLTSLTHTKNAGSTLSAWSYTRSAAGRVATETGAGRTRSFTYDGAERLTQAADSPGSTRNYAYDANTNRCAKASACDGSYTYDNADRLLSSPLATGYTYDSHGNLISANPTSQPPTQSLAQSFVTDASVAPATSSFPIEVGQVGPVSASLDWTPTPFSQSATITGTIAAQGTTSTVSQVLGQTGMLGSLSWTKGLHSVTSASSLSVPAGGTATKTITTDGTGSISGELDWGATILPWSPPGGTVSSTAQSQTNLTVTDGGPIDVTVNWPAPSENTMILTLWDGNTKVRQTTGVGCSQLSGTCSTSLTTYIDPHQSGSTPYSHTYAVSVSTVGTTTSYTLTGSYPVAPSLSFELDNSSGTSLATSTWAAGPPHVKVLSYPNAPAGTYVYKVSSSDYAAATTLKDTHVQADYANLTLSVNGPSGSASAQSATGSISVPKLAGTGAYTWTITNNSADLSVPSYTLVTSQTTESTHTSSATALPWPVTSGYTYSADGAGPAWASLSWPKDAFGNYECINLDVVSGGTELASGTGCGGTLAIEANLPARGPYSFNVANQSTTTPTSYTLTVNLPQIQQFATSLTLTNSSGQVVATGTGSKPITLSTTPSSAGVYNLVVQTTSGSATANLTATYPPPPLKELISYDGNDHATTIDDGAHAVAETLAPSGRVLRRVVTDDITGAVTEDTSFGYDDWGDSPVYSRPTGGGAVLSYVDGPGGLLLIDSGGTASYPLPNGHGDIVGTTDASGAFTANADFDEFGNGQVPSNRLGWLGGKERFTTGGQLGLIRMGVRLYDPTLGRFLEADPVEGGSANAYDYGYQDPVNNCDPMGLGFIPDMRIVCNELKRMADQILGGEGRHKKMTPQRRKQYNEFYQKWKKVIRFCETHFKGMKFRRPPSGHSRSLLRILIDSIGVSIRDGVREAA